MWVISVCSTSLQQLPIPTTDLPRRSSTQFRYLRPSITPTLHHPTTLTRPTKHLRSKFQLGRPKNLSLKYLENQRYAKKNTKESTMKLYFEKNSEKNCQEKTGPAYLMLTTFLPTFLPSFLLPELTLILSLPATPQRTDRYF